jgi:hypothetical protein
MDDPNAFLDDQLNQDEKPYHSNSTEVVNDALDTKPTVGDTTMTSSAPDENE